MLILDVLIIALVAGIATIPVGIGIGYHLAKRNKEQPERIILSPYWREEPKDW